MHWYTVLNLNSHLKRRRWRWGVSQWCWGAFAGTTLRYNEHIRFCQLKKPQMWQFAEFSQFHMVSFTLPFVRESTGEYTPSHFLSSFILVYHILICFDTFYLSSLHSSLSPSVCPTSPGKGWCSLEWPFFPYIIQKPVRCLPQSDWVFHHLL